MSYMFSGASSFNQDVSEWDVSNVNDMSYMFCGASSFDQDVSEWDVSKITNVSLMFDEASLCDQDISKRDVSSVQVEDNMISGTKVQVALEKYCGRYSFFDSDCRDMSRIERQQFFSTAFPWRRLSCCFWLAKDTCFFLMRKLLMGNPLHNFVMCYLMWKIFIVKYASFCEVQSYYQWQSIWLRVMSTYVLRQRFVMCNRATEYILKP